MLLKQTQSARSSKLPHRSPEVDFHAGMHFARLLHHIDAERTGIVRTENRGEVLLQALAHCCEHIGRNAQEFGRKIGQILPRRSSLENIETFVVELPISVRKFHRKILFMRIKRFYFNATLLAQNPMDAPLLGFGEQAINSKHAAPTTAPRRFQYHFSPTLQRVRHGFKGTAKLRLAETFRHIRAK